MSFCFGFISNDAALTSCALAPYQESLLLPGGAPHGWGLAYYQADQPLLRKQPMPLLEPLSFTAAAATLQTNLLLGHARSATVGGQRTENTHPFRYRSWTFCHSGTVHNFEEIKDEVLRSVPDHIRRNIRGKTDSEHVFHLFLSFLSDTGQLDNTRLSSHVAAQALRSTFAYLSRMQSSAAEKPESGCCLASNGRFILAYTDGLPLHISRHSSYVCPDGAGKPVAVGHLASSVILGGSPPRGVGWERVRENTAIGVDSGQNIEVLG